MSNDYVALVNKIQRALLDNTPIKHTHAELLDLVDTADDHARRCSHFSDAARIARWVARSLAFLDGPAGISPFESYELQTEYARHQRWLKRPPKPKPAATPKPPRLTYKERRAARRKRSTRLHNRRQLMELSASNG